MKKQAKKKSTNNKAIKWSDRYWIPQERWGDSHPDKPLVWYDPKKVNVDSSGNLILDVYKSVRGKNKVGVGLISCLDRFGYGHFEISCKLPVGPNLWPAFWMWSFDSWPPEIDVFEAYTNKRGSYFDIGIESVLGQIWDVQSNIHLGKQPDNYSTGAKKHYFGFKDPSKHFIKYAVKWTSTEISIYYDDRLVRYINDEDVVGKLRGHFMNVIINNSVHNDYDPENKERHCPMIVEYFKYTPLEE